MRRPLLSVIRQGFAIAALALSGACVQAPPPAAPPMADRVVVQKSKRTLELLRDGKVFATFPAALGREPRGPKQQEGDGRTPEGLYRMQSRYTRALHVSYPDERDRERARAVGVDPGGAIFVHGLPPDYGPFDPPRWYRDWTEGCISVGNVAIAKTTGELRRGNVSCRPEREDLKMSAKGIVIPADGGRRLDGLTPGGRFDLKLVGRDTADSIMLFEEICPVGRKSRYHLHRDSDEVIWVVAGEFSFKIGDEVTTGGPGTCAFMPRGVAHAWKNIGNDTGRLVGLYTPAAAGGYIEELLEEGRPQTPEESKALADRHHWEIVGPNPL